MKIRQLAEGVDLLATVDWNRRLFDSLIPLPDGTSYNAYLVGGTDKVALIDTVDPPLWHVLEKQLEGVERIDYVICQHAEQDHSGSIPLVLAKYPEARVLTNAKCRDMLIDLLGIAEERFQIVEDGETIDLGGKTLEFIYLPWVHWPETMGTWLQEERILFSCDFLGSHLATTDTFVTDQALTLEAAKRYYAEIMMPFRLPIQRNLTKILAKDIRMVAPSHGPVFDQPGFILEAYQDWSSDAVKNEVVLPYVSMHGSTEKMAFALLDSLVARDVKVHLFDLVVTDIGKLAISLVDAATLVLGSPTVHVGPHPAAHYAANLANAIRPKVRFASLIGSYGWSTRMVEQVAGMLPNLKAEILDPVICKGDPTAETYAQLDQLAAAIAERHTSL